MTYLNTDTNEVTMFQMLLKRLIDDGLLDVQQMARLTGIDPTTIHRWASGDSMPNFMTFFRFFRAAPSDIQQALLNLLTQDTRWHCFYVPDDFDLDVNGDGKINAQDARDAMGTAVMACGKQILETGIATADGKIDDSERSKLDTISRQTINHVLTANAVIAHIYKQQCPRRKVQHTLHAGGGAA